MSHLQLKDRRLVRLHRVVHIQDVNYWQVVRRVHACQAI